MAIRVTIEDTGLELAVCVAVTGGYNPDVLHDLQARATETYRTALVDKMAVMQAAGTDSDDEDG